VTAVTHSDSFRPTLEYCVNFRFVNLVNLPRGDFYKFSNFFFVSQIYNSVFIYFHIRMTSSATNDSSRPISANSLSSVNRLFFGELAFSVTSFPVRRPVSDQSFWVTHRMTSSSPFGMTHPDDHVTIKSLQSVSLRSLQNLF
jgi:hypothetical protein